MLRKFAAALIASTLIAAPAVAAQSDTSNAPAAAQTSPAKTDLEKTAPAVKHVKSHGHRHLTRSKTAHQARHAKPGKAHQASAKSAPRS